MTGWRMRSTASALGVIAIVSVMITATASETDNGAIEHSINHPVVDEDDRGIREAEDTTNGTTGSQVTVTLEIRGNDTAYEVTEPRLIRDPVNHNRTTSFPVEVQLAEDVEPQKDQSESGPLTVDNVVDKEEHGLAGTERIPERDSTRNKVQNTSRDYPMSTRSSRTETASSTSPWEGQLPIPWRSEFEDVQVDDEGLSNVLETENEEEAIESVLEKHNREYLDGAVTWITGIVTEAKAIEQKNGDDDVRSISFPVPPPPSSVEDLDELLQSRQLGDEEPRIGTRKDHSRPVNNLLLGAGKSTKAFYEIKPSIKTEMENDQLYLASTLRTLAGRKFVLPTVDSAFGKFGPYFQDGDKETNITARIGSTMLLDCRIGMLGNKEVAWVQQHSEDSFRLLTIGKTTYSVDQRISLNFRYPSNWRLQILYASPRDSGLYKCQIATHPPLVKKINVVVTAPELTITDDSGRVVPKERHLKAGSALKLRCEARDVLESLKETVIWTRGDETLTNDVSENRTTELSAGKDVLVIVSTLVVERASPRHAGNYSCVVPGKANTTIAVHVLNGELPAAVHDGNGVSRAFLNLWLIHLTMSYVFTR
ncbi:PREDICTED: uncharacterized protein LOC107188935 [Dufourea novaeangliae]|uniref:uncharacterized protein LOC107188935 n=1 Tax=Dufourea novaeangliae TaxID=178035 RepID=UPI000767424A|nr:PREDICTED: uncharacterized protein LOC107188935 [Dufourea novaeangliae]